MQACGGLTEQLRPLCKLCGRFGAIFSHQSFLGCHNYEAFCVCYSSLLQSKDSPSHIVGLSIWVSLYIYIRRFMVNGDRFSDRRYVLADCGVDRHHHTIQNVCSIFPSSCCHALLPSYHRSTQFVWFLTHFCQAFIDQRNSGCSWSPNLKLFPLTCFVQTSHQNHSIPRCLFWCYSKCGRILIMSALHTRFAIWLHCDQVCLEMYLEAIIEWVLRCTGRL